MLNISFIRIITIIASTSIEIIILKLFLNEISKVKIKSKYMKTQLFILGILIVFFNIKLSNKNISFIPIYIFINIFYIYNYEVTIFKSCIITLIYYIIIITLEAIGINVIILTNDISDINEILINDLIFIELVFISKSLLALLIPIVKFKRLELKLHMKIREYIFSLIPLISNILSIIIIYSSKLKINYTNIKVNIMPMITTFIIFISNILFLYIICRVIKYNNLKLENKIIKEKININCDYYAKLKECYLNTRKLYHDMNNHIIYIQHLQNIGKSEDSYINEIKKRLETCNEIFNTGVLILDIILTDKKVICNKNNIEFDVNIDFSYCKFIDIVDICIIFSNMIDNAIEACKKMNDNERKFIKLKGFIIKEFYVIKCKNTKINKINFKDKRILTDKQDKTLHGLGIQSIKTSVEKYDGNMELDINELNFTLIIYIPVI